MSGPTDHFFRERGGPNELTTGRNQHNVLNYMYQTDREKKSLTLLTLSKTCLAS